jgi:DNA repair exonuclease SbcCD ATPase subunit
MSFCPISLLLRTKDPGVLQVSHKRYAFASENSAALQRIEEALQKLDGRLGKVESNLGKVESNLGKVESNLSKLETDLNHKFEILNHKFEILEIKASSAVLLNVGAYLAPGLGLLALANALGLLEKFKS